DSGFSFHASVPPERLVSPLLHGAYYTGTLPKNQSLIVGNLPGAGSGGNAELCGEGVPDFWADLPGLNLAIPLTISRIFPIIYPVGSGFFHDPREYQYSVAAKPRLEIKERKIRHDLF